MKSPVCFPLKVLSTAGDLKQPRTKSIVSFAALLCFILRVYEVNLYVTLCLLLISALRENITNDTPNFLLAYTKIQSESTHWCGVFTAIKTEKERGIRLRI